MRRMNFLERIPVRFSKNARPVWAEISLPQLRKNYEAIRQRVGERCDVMAVVKANAYGHGATVVSRMLAAEGVRWFGVGMLEEALELRRARVDGNILILSIFLPEQASAALTNGIQVTASTLAHLNALQRAASRKHPAPVHLKFDTGMGRMGFSCDDAEMLAQQWARGRWSHLRLQGVFSHLASADEVDSPQNALQGKNFSRVLKAFKSEGVEIPARHLANTAGISFHRRSHYDLVRAGIALYGYEPRAPQRPALGTAPALTFRTRILHLKSVPPGTALGYGGAFVTRRHSVIAVLPLGYADGVNRRLSFANAPRHRRENARPRPMNVVIHNQPAPVVGRVSMDLTFVDVTDVNGVRVNDEVVLMGGAASGAPGAVEWADYTGTAAYEILCGISPRVYRVYVKS